MNTKEKNQISLKAQTKIHKISFYHFMQKLLQNQEKQYQKSLKDQEPIANQNTKFYRSIQFKLCERISFSIGDINTLQSLFTNFGNSPVASNLNEIHAVLHLAYYTIFNVSEILVSPRNLQHQKACGSLFLSISGALSTSLKSIKMMFEDQQNKTRSHGYDKIQRMIIKLYKCLTSGSVYGSHLLLYRSHPGLKKYSFGNNKFKFENNINIVFQLAEEEGKKEEDILQTKTVSGIDSTLIKFTEEKPSMSLDIQNLFKSQHQYFYKDHNTSSTDPLAIQNAFDRICLNKTGKFLVQKSKLHQTMLGYYKMKLQKSIEKPQMFQKLKLGRIIELISYLQSQISNFSKFMDQKLVASITKSVNDSLSDFLNFFMTSFSQFSIDMVFIKQALNNTSLHARFSIQLFEILDFCPVDHPQLLKLTKGVLQEVFPIYLTTQPSFITGKEEWIMITSNVIVNTLKLIKNSQNFVLSSVQIRNMIDVVAALLNSKKFDLKKGGQEDSKKKQIKQQQKQKQTKQATAASSQNAAQPIADSPKLSIPATNKPQSLTGIAQANKVLIEQIQEQIVISSDQEDPSGIKPQNENETSNMILNLCNMAFKYIYEQCTNNKVDISEMEYSDLKYIINTISKIHQIIPSGLILAEAHKGIRSHSFAVLNKICHSVKSQNQLEEFIIGLMQDSQKKTTTINYALFKFIDIAKINCKSFKFDKLLKMISQQVKNIFLLSQSSNDSKTSIKLPDDLYTIHAPFLLACLILFRQLPRAIIIPHVSNLLSEINAILRSPQQEKNNLIVLKWSVLLQMSFAFELAVFDPQSQDQQKVLSNHFNKLISNSLNQPAYYIGQLQKCFTLFNPLLPLQEHKSKLKFLPNLKFPHYSYLTLVCNRKMPRIEANLTQYFRQFICLNRLRGVKDQILEIMFDMSNNLKRSDLQDRIEKLLDRNIQALVKDSHTGLSELKQFELLVALYTTSTSKDSKDNQLNIRIQSKLAKKMMELIEFSNDIIDREVNECEQKAPEKAARSKVLLHHSHFISQLNPQQFLPRHLMANQYLSCIFDDVLKNELSQELKQRIDGVYDILAKRPFSIDKNSKSGEEQMVRGFLETNPEIQKLVVFLLKDKWIGRNYIQTKQVILMQSLCILLFPPSFVKNQSIEKFVAESEEQKLEVKKQIINSYYHVSNSNTFNLLQYFSFSMHQWLKGISMMQKSIEKLNGINTAFHVSEIFRQIRDITSQSQQSTQLLVEWDDYVRSTIKCAEQNVLVNKQIEKMMIQEKVGADKDAEILYEVLKEGGMQWNIQFAQILQLILLYPSNDKLLVSYSNKREEQSAPVEAKNEQSSQKTGDNFIVKSKPNAVLMSFEFAKPATDGQKPNQAKKGIPGKFLSHLKDKQKAAKKEQSQKKTNEITRQLLFGLFSKYFNQIFMKQPYSAENLPLYIQLRQKLCCLDAVQLEQFIYLISNEAIILGKTQTVFEKDCSKQMPLISFSYPAHFKTFIQHLFPLGSLEKQNPFALNVLKSLIDMSNKFFCEDDEQDQKVDDDDDDGLKYKPLSKVQLQEFFNNKQIVKKGVSKQMQEIVEVISHLSWATDTNNEDLSSLCNSLVETITTNYHSIAAQSIMRLIISNDFFKNLLKQSSDSDQQQQMFERNYESTASQYSQNETSDSDFPSSDDKKPRILQDQQNPMKALLERGFGFLTQKSKIKLQTSKDQRPATNEHGIEGLDEKQTQQQDLLKDQNCTYMKTKQQFASQHWYTCQTCGLNQNRGVCSVCAASCHRGHNVVYNKKGSFYCDCPETNACQSCPKPQNIVNDKRSPYQFDMGSYGGRKPLKYGEIPQMGENSMSYGQMRKIRKTNQKLRQRMEQRYKQKLERKKIGKKMMTMMMNQGSKQDELEDKLHNYKDFLKLQSQSQAMPSLQGIVKKSKEIIKQNQDSVSFEDHPNDSVSDSDESFSMVYEINRLYGGNKDQKQEIEEVEGFLQGEAIKPLQQEQDINQKTDVVLVGEEGKKNQQGHVQIPFFMNPPQFKSGAVQIQGRQQLEVRAGPSPMIEILMEQCKDEAIQMTIQAMILNALSELKEIYSNKEKNSPQLAVVGSSKLSSSQNIVNDMFMSGKDLYQVVHGDLKVLPSKFYQLPEEKIKLKFQQSSPAIQNTVRVMRNRPNFSHNIDYSPQFDYTVIAECNAVSFINQNVLDTLISKGGSQSSKLDASQFKKSFTHKIGWPVIGVKVNPMNQSFVLVYGMQNCVVLVVRANSSGFQNIELAQQIEIQLQIQAFGGQLNMIDVRWLPNSQVHVAVTTPLFMKIYDLSFNRMRPTHYLTLAQGNFSSTCIIQQDKEGGAQNTRDTDTYRIYSGSQDGIIFTIKIDIERRTCPSLDNELMLVESINHQGLQPFNSPVVSISCFPRYNHLLIVSWSNGDNLIGMLDKNNHSTIKTNVCFQVPKISQSNKIDLNKKYPPAKLLQKGPVLSNIKHSIETPSHILLFAVWKITSQNNGCFVCIKLSKRESLEDRIKFHFMKTVPNEAESSQYVPCGIAYVPKSKEHEESRVVTTYEHGIICSYSFNEAEKQQIQNKEQDFEQENKGKQKSSNKKLSGWSKLIRNKKNKDENAVKFQSSSTHNRKLPPIIEKSWLPEVVNKPVTCFEKMVQLDQIKSNNIVLSGDLLKKWRQGKSAVEALNNINNQEAFRSSEKEIKFQIALQGGFLLSGLYFQIKVGKYYNMKLLNRNIKIKPDQRFYILPLCQAEIYYIIQTGVNRLDIVISAQDAGNSRNDLSIRTMRLYALRKSDFKCSEKQDIIRKFVMKKNANTAERKKELQEKKQRKEQMEKMRKERDEIRKNQGYFSEFERFSSIISGCQDSQSQINDITMMLPVYLLAKQPSKSSGQSAAITTAPKNVQIYQSALNLITCTRFIDQDKSNQNQMVEAQLMSQFLSFFLKNQNDKSFGGSLLRNYSRVLNLLKGSSSKSLLYPKNFNKFLQIVKDNSSDFILLLGQFNDQLLSLIQQWVGSNIVSHMTNETASSVTIQQQSKKSQKLQIIQNIIKLLLELLTYHLNNSIQEQIKDGIQFCHQHIINGYRSIIQSSSSKTPIVFKILQLIVTILTASNQSMKFKDTILREISNELFERSKSFYLLFKNYNSSQPTHIESKALQFATDPFKKNDDQVNLIDFMNLKKVKAYYIPIDLIPLIIDALCSSYSPKFPNLCMLSQILHYSFLFLVSHERIIKDTLIELGVMTVRPVIRLIESVIAVSPQDVGEQNLQTEALYFVLNFLIMINTRSKSKSDSRKLEFNFAKIEEAGSLRQKLINQFEAPQFVKIDKPVQKKASGRQSLGIFYRSIFTSQFERKCQFTEWSSKKLTMLYEKFLSGNGTLRAVQVDNVPIKVQERKISLVSDELLNPSVNKGNWTWMSNVLSQNKNERLNMEIVRSDLSIRDQIFTQLILLIIQNILQFEKGIDKIVKSDFKKLKQVGLNAMQSFLKSLPQYQRILANEGYKQSLLDFLSKLKTNFITKKICSKLCKKLIIEILQFEHSIKSLDISSNMILRSNLKFKIENLDLISNLTNNFQKPFTYEQLLFQVNCVADLWRYISSNPKEWKNYIYNSQANNGEKILQNLMVLIQKAGPQSIQNILSIVTVSLERKSPTLLKAKYSKSASVGSYFNEMDSRLNIYLKHLFKHFTRSKKSSATRKQDSDKQIGQNIFPTTLIKWTDYVVKNYLTKGDRRQRIVASHFIKGVLETIFGQRDSAKNKLYDRPISKIINLILQRFRQGSDEGANCAELMGFLSWLCSQDHISEDKGLLHEIIHSLMENVISVNYAIDSHQNLQIYSALHKILGTQAFSSSSPSQLQNSIQIVDDQGSNFFERIQQQQQSSLLSNQSKPKDFLYLLQSDPCMRCYQSLRNPFQLYKISSVKNDIKFTESSHIIQFKEPLMISQIVMDLFDQKGTMTLKTVVIYINNKIGNDLMQLKSNRSLWTRMRSVDISQTQQNLQVKFPVPVSAVNLQIEFQGGPKSKKNLNSSQNEVQLGGGRYMQKMMQMGILGDMGGFCMRCGRQVQDKHGVCVNCGENAYQCPFCRNINYENPTAFLCNQCGLSRYTKFQINLKAKLGAAVETLQTQEQKRAMEERIQTASNKMANDIIDLHRKRGALQGLVCELEQTNILVSSKIDSQSGSNLSKTTKKNIASEIGSMYTVDCIASYSKYMTQWTQILNLRKEVMRFQNRDMEVQQVSQFSQNNKNQNEIDLIGEDEQQYMQPMKIEHHHKTLCFGCNMNFLYVSLAFIRQLAVNPYIAEFMLEASILQILHSKTMRNFSQDHRKLATSTLCRMVTSNAQSAIQLVETLERQFSALIYTDEISSNNWSSNINSPTLLAQHLQDDIQLVIKLLSVAENELFTKNNTQAQELFTRLIRLFWKVLNKAVIHGQRNGAIADRILTPCLDYLLNNLQKQDLLRDMYKQFKGNQVFGDRKQLQQQEDKNVMQLQEIAMKMRQQRSQGLLGQMLDQQGLQDQLILQSGALAQVVENLDNVVADVPMPQLDFPQIQQSAPQQLKQLQATNPEQAAVVYSQAAKEMSEWCKFIKAQTCPITESSDVFPISELSQPKSQIIQMLEKRSQASLFDTNNWLNGAAVGQQQEQQANKNFEIDSNNWLIKCLLIPTSQTVRKIAKSLLISQVINDIQLSQSFIIALSANLEKALLLNNIGQQYFDTFHLLIKQCEFFQSEDQQQVSQEILEKQSGFLSILQILLLRIDSQLQRLLNQMGHGSSFKDSFSNFEQTLSRSINSGYGLTRMIQMTFDLIGVKFVRSHFKSKQHSFVKNMIKSHLKVKKLSSIMKNSSISQCQKILEKMFNILRSQGKKEMHGFIFECMRILGEPYTKSGVDMSEQMFLMDQIRKIIDPQKPEPVYLLNLHKAPSQDVYIRGKMNKNPYSSKQFIKESASAQDDGEGQGSKVPLMKHVRDKIAHQLEISSELMEMLVDNKIIDLEIPIRLVYQKAWWPAICRKNNPDLQRIPPISEAEPNDLLPMSVIFRLAGLDGEATEDRIESLQDDAGDQDCDVQTKFELANAISDKFLIEGESNQTTGIAILLEKVSKLRKDMPAKERYYSESLIKILELSCRIAINRKQVIKHGGTKILVQKLIQMLPMTTESAGSPKRAQGNQQSISVVSDLLLLTLQNVLIQAGGESQLDIEVVSRAGGKITVDKAAIVEEQDKQSSSKIVQILTEKLSHYCKPKSRLSSLETRYIKAITRILPYVTFNDPFAIEKLVRTFTQNLEYESLDLPVSSDPELTKKQFYTERFIALVTAIPDHFFVFKEIMLTRMGVMSYMETYFQKNLFKKTEQKKEQRKLNDGELSQISGSLRAVLESVHGLCKCSASMQSALNKSGYIPVLYKLSLAKLNNQRELSIQAQKLIKLLSTLPQLPKPPKRSIQTNQIIQLQNQAEKAVQQSMIQQGSKDTGVHQTQLIDQLYDHTTFEYVNSLIDQTKAARKKKAEDKKLAIFKKMGMKKGAGGTFAQAKATDMKQLFGVSAEQIKEEQGLRCIICHDGYQIQNKTVLGVYIFVESADFSQYIQNFNNANSGLVSQLELLVAQIKGPSKEQQIIPGMNQAQNGSQLNRGYTSVSYFNCIHFQCHRSAYDAEKKLNQPKKQWQGAMIRNSHTKCNNLLPIHGPHITDDEYRKLLDRYFQMINQQCNLPEINSGNGITTYRNRFRMLVHDIRCLFLRFGLQESFSFHSKGGGPEHNIQYLPFLMQAAYFTYGQLVNQIASQSNVVSQTNEYKEIMRTILDNIQQGNNLVASGDIGKLKEQENKQETVKYKLAKSLNTINYGFYLCISLMFSSAKQWQTEKMHWIDAAISRARNQVGLFLENQNQLQQQEKKSKKKDDSDVIENQILGVKALVVLKDLKNGQGLSKMQNSLLLCLRPSLVVLALIDGFKKKFEAKMQQIPALQGEYQNKMKELLRSHNQHVMKTSQQLPKDYKEITDFTQISHFLNFMSIENAEEVEQHIMAKLFAGME